MPNYPSDTELNYHLAVRILNWTNVRWYADNNVYVGIRPGGTAVTPIPDIIGSANHYSEVLKKLVVFYGYSVTVQRNETRTMLEAVIVTESGVEVRAEGSTVGLALGRAAWLGDQAEEW